MYEEGKRKLNINWKSLIIKLGILLLLVFLICFILFKPKKNKNDISLKNNIIEVKEAAINYFKNNMTLESIADYAKITLEQLENEELIIKQKDSKGNVCNSDKSYAYLTKVRDDEFVLKINMLCGKNEESKVFNITSKDLEVITNSKQETEDPKEEINIDKNDVESSENNKPIIKDELTSNDKVIINDKKEEQKKEENTITNANNNKVLRYKHVKYGDWTEGISYSNSTENSTIKVHYYEYCLDDNCVIDRFENLDKYLGYTATYKYTKDVDVYRYVYVVWSNSTCIKGFTNTGITEYR